MNSLVIDFGTATTFDLIENGIYQGGLIAPGINTSLDALINTASKLTNISLIETNKIIGKKKIIGSHIKIDINEKRLSEVIFKKWLVGIIK